ncbi:terminase [Gordonia sp. CPCC 206044]|uniref:terminase n=1 Tax=Gordonia sp. CPCC 206044 TaxID=3140793 RepID=UPI003AF40234
MSLPDPAPRYFTPRNPDRKTYGSQVAKVANILGTPLMPWQRYAADVAGEVDDSGLFIYPIVVWTVPRQAGKTALSMATCNQRCLIKPRRRVWHTAQTGLDATDLFLATADELETSPLSSVVKIRKSAGSQWIRYANGSTIRPHPPKESSLHGKQSDLNFIDEAWSFSEVTGQALMQAIVPTQATRPGAQTIIVSTAGTAESTWFREFVERGRAGDPGICYLEYSIPDDIDALDLEAVASYHPAYGHTMDMDAFVRAAAQFGDTPGGFARAYGNRWTQTREQVIPLDAFERVQTDEPIPKDARVAFGAAVSIDRSSAAICAAAIVDDEPIVELIDFRPGVDWLGPRLKELNERHSNSGLVVDGHGPSSTVVDYLDLNRVALLPLTTKDVTAACAEVLDRIKQGRIKFRRNQDITDAVTCASTRNVSDQFAWSRRGSAGSIAPLEAATLAVRAVTHLQAPPPKPKTYFAQSE